MPLPQPVPGEGTGLACSEGDGLWSASLGLRRAPARSILCIWTVAYCKRNVNVSQQITRAQKKKVLKPPCLSRACFWLGLLFTLPSFAQSRSLLSLLVFERFQVADRRVLSTCRDSFRNQGYLRPGMMRRLLFSLPHFFMEGKVKGGKKNPNPKTNHLRLFCSTGCQNGLLVCSWRASR